MTSVRRPSLSSSFRSEVPLLHLCSQPPAAKPACFDPLICQLLPAWTITRRRLIEAQQETRIHVLTIQRQSGLRLHSFFYKNQLNLAEYSDVPNFRQKVRLSCSYVLSILGKNSLILKKIVFLFLFFSKMRLKLFLILGNSEARVLIKIVPIKKKECRSTGGTIF